MLDDAGFVTSEIFQKVHQIFQPNRRLCSFYFSFCNSNFNGHFTHTPIASILAYVFCVLYTVSPVDSLIFTSTPTVHVDYQLLIVILTLDVMLIVIILSVILLIIVMLKVVLLYL